MTEKCRCGKKLTKRDKDGMCKRCRKEKNNNTKKIAGGAIAALATVATVVRFVVFRR